MGVVGTVVVEADALVWNFDCRVAPARTLVLFLQVGFFGSAAVALCFAGQRFLGIGFGLMCAVNLALIYLLGPGTLG